MKIQRSMAVLCIVSLWMGSAQAVVPQVDLSEAVSQVAVDSTLISQWLRDQLKNAVAFNSTAGNVVPSQLKIFGVEVGVNGVVTTSKVDEDGLRRLNTTLVDTSKIESTS